MNIEQLHWHISENTGNESNICQIYAIKDNEVALDDCWHGFKTLDFKHVNDTYGHDVGDVVLKSIVNIVKEFIEDNHVFGRWGGEEFLYLFPNSDVEKALEFAERIRQTIDDTCFVTVQHITVSIGVTMIRPEDTIDTFVKRADEALYNAKETGRNRVVIADFT